MKAILIASLVALALSACATRQVNPVYMQEEKRVCIIENPRVLHDFLGAYRRTLEGRGFQVEVFPETANASVCPVTTMYTANWRWDMVLYLAYAELRVYKDGKPAGRAIHNARGSRFITAEGKIQEMVDELYKR